MKNVLLLSLLVLLVGCASPDDEARALIGEARTLYESAKFKVRKENSSDKTGTVDRAELIACVEKASLAAEKIKQVYKDYPSTPVANEMGTKILMGKIKGRRNECSRLEKRFQK